MHTPKKKIAFSIFMVVSIPLVAELGLQALSLLSPEINNVLSLQEQRIKDPVFGVRPNPQYPGHDRKGFRNKSIPDGVTILALGDSQTYGAGVGEEDAWPQQLATLLQVKTYNMAFSSYGPVHSLLLMDEACSLKPKIIIEAFYAGNDLYDAYHLVYGRGQRPDLKTDDIQVLTLLADAEYTEPLCHKVQRVFAPGGKRACLDPAVTSFLSRHSRLYRLQRNWRYRIARFLAQRSKSDHCSVRFDHPHCSTAFTPNYRLCVLDRNDPRIVEGMRISLQACALMNERAQKEDIGFIVLLIPTKELVFKELVSGSPDQICGAYRELVENEEICREQMKEFLTTRHIRFIDTLPFLRDVLRAGHSPYPKTPDGHLNVRGQRAIADGVARSL